MTIANIDCDSNLGPEPIRIEDEASQGFSDTQLQTIKCDIIRGSARFWRKRGGDPVNRWRGFKFGAEVGL